LRVRAQPLLWLMRWHDMTTTQTLHPGSLHPMTGFNPSEPAILHDLATDRIITWTGDQADDFRRVGMPRDDGTVAWRQYVFDGWGNVLGG
jgi:hypothetical protein